MLTRDGGVGEANTLNWELIIRSEGENYANLFLYMPYKLDQ
jgi:hypothetical protein